MKKNLGFSSFEFYFVAAVIGLVLIVGIQRYQKLAEETRRLSFEILAQNFSAAVYNQRSRWIVAQQSFETPEITLDNKMVQFSKTGWPIAVTDKAQPIDASSVASCVSLWNAFLHDAPAISLSDTSPKANYAVTLSTDGKCHFEILMPKGFYFEYSSVSGEVKIFVLASAKNS